MVRLTVELTKDLADEIKQTAEEDGITISRFFRQAFALLKITHSAKLAGRHVGLVADPAKLDTEIIW